MTTVIGNYILVFVALFNLSEINAVFKLLSPPVDTLLKAKPGFTIYVPLHEFIIEPKPFIGAIDSDRIFNNAQETPLRNYRYFQINVGLNLKFKFEQDAYERIINVCMLPKNDRPKRHLRHRYSTHVATAKQIQFLIHMDRQVIVGASPPPNQIPRPKVQIDSHKPQVETGPHQPQENIGHSRPQVEIGSHQPQVEMGPHQPQENIGHRLPQLKMDSQTPQKNIGHRQPQVEIDSHQPQVEIISHEHQVDTNLYLGLHAPNVNLHK